MDDRNKPHLMRVQVVDDQGNVVGHETVRAENLKSVGTPRSVLTEAQKARARALWPRVGREARPDIDLQRWVDGFGLEARPDQELDVWEHIAAVTDELWQAGVGTTRAQLLHVVLNVSIETVDIPSQVAGVTDVMVERVRDRWQRGP